MTLRVVQRRPMTRWSSSVSAGSITVNRWNAMRWTACRVLYGSAGHFSRRDRREASVSITCSSASRTLHIVSVGFRSISSAEISRTSESSAAREASN